MQVSVEKIGPLARRMSIEVFADSIEKKVAERLVSLSKTIKIAGFRPEKTPLKIVEQHRGEAVRSEVIHDIMHSAFYEAVAKQGLSLAAAPQIIHDHEHHPKKGQALIFTAEFDILPEIKLKNFAEIKIEKVLANITDTDLDKTIDTIRKQYAEWETVERAAQIGDQLTIDFEAAVDNQLLPNNTASNFVVELGSHKLLPELEQGLIGAVSGQDISIDTTFPLTASSHAGKIAHFKIHVHAVKAANVPILNAEFAERLGVKDRSVETLRSAVRQNLERELDQILKDKLKKDVMDALYQANTIDLPATLVRQEIHHLQEQMRVRLDKQVDFKTFIEQNYLEFETQACRRVNLNLILVEIIKQHQLKPDAKKLSKLITNIAAAYEQPEEIVNWLYQDKQRLSEMERLVLEEQIIETVVNAAQVSEKHISFAEATQIKTNAR